jgi:hypothetical protein
MYVCQRACALTSDSQQLMNTNPKTLISPEYMNVRKCQVVCKEYQDFVNLKWSQVNSCTLQYCPTEFYAQSNAQQESLSLDAQLRKDCYDLCLPLFNSYEA